MGTQNVTIDKQIYSDLEDKFRENGLLLENKQGKEKFGNITKDIIRSFLKLTGWTKHYDDVVLIYHKMTGKSVPIIPPDLKVKLLQDFEKVSNAYDTLFKSNDSNQIQRKSFINKHHILYHLLKKNNFDCEKEDFNMLKTNERLVDHEDIISKIFKHLDWNFFTIF